MTNRKSATQQLAAFLLCTLATGAFVQSPAASPSLPVAQPPQTAPAPSAPTLKVTTQLTIENVTVTDAQGKPVHGLKQSDFTVKEDGKPQTIKNFEEFSTMQAEAPPYLPPNVYTNRQPAAPSAVNILLFDNVTPGFAATMGERLAAIKYLKTLPEGTEVSILKEANGVSVVQGFTTDRNLLLTAIDSLKPEPSLGAYDVPVLPQSSIGDPEVQREAFLESRCTVVNRQSERTLDALTGIASSVSGIKGRKNLIWFTPGSPQLTHYALVSSNKNGYCIHDFTAELQRAYGRLNAAQVAVYPVSGNGDLPSMWAIADATGGAAYTGSNDLAALMGEAIAAGSSGYYSLSYVPPPSKFDGKYHTVEVKVDRPGLRLHYRTGYTDIDYTKAPAEEEAGKDARAPESEFRKTVDQGMVVATGLEFGLRVEPSTAQAKPGDPPVAGTINSRLKGKQLVRYTLTYELPPGEVTLVDGPDGTRKGSVEFDVVASGEDGEKLNVVRDAVNFTLKPNEVEYYDKNPILMSVQIDLPKGAVTLHAGVLDVASQKMGTLEIPEKVVKK